MDEIWDNFSGNTLNIIKIAKVNFAQDIGSKFNESFHIADIGVWPRQTENKISNKFRSVFLYALYLKMMPRRKTMKCLKNIRS